MPRVTLDVQALQSVAHAERGIGRSVGAHTVALLRAGARIERCLLNPLLGTPRFLPAELASSGLLAWDTAREVDAVARGGAFVHHVMSPFEDVRPVDALVAPHVWRQASAIAVTLFDAIPYVMVGEYQRTWWNRQFLTRRAALIRSADLVCAISESAARDAIDVLGVDRDRVAVVGQGPSPVFRLPGRGENPAGHLARVLPELRRPFVLTVTGDDPRKDPLGLVDAYAALPADVRREHQLVMVCTLLPHTEQAWREHAARRGLTPTDVVFTGYVDDVTLLALYHCARLFAFTSRREGFGLPVLEAAASGCPAITADNSSLPEVLDEPASRYPTGDHGALADLLARALTDDGLRSVLLTAAARAARTHTWKHAAQRTMDAYARFADVPARPSVHRRRVALAGPFAPASSGVADYNERVAAALAPRCALDAFAEVDPPYTRATTAGRRFSIHAFGRTFDPAGYDGVVHALGNSRFHRATLDHALRYPGVVWLHDACLAGLYLTRAGLYLPGVATEEIDFDAARAAMRAALVRCHGDDRAWLGDDWWKPEAYVDAGVLMLEEVLRAARAVIVSTSEARHIVEAHAPTGLPVHVVPLAVPTRAAAAAARGEDGAPWIVTLGVVSTVKRIDDVVRAFARLRLHVAARLAVVGNVEPHYADELRALAGELGVADDVVVTGLVPAAEYDTWVERASVVVQLRTRSVGEGSATVTDALAAGRAVVTNVGSVAELPDGVVDRVPLDADVEGLARHIERVLRDGDHRGALEAAAFAYAGTHTFAHVAAAVLDIVGETAEPRYPQRLAVGA
jgi:glycosyltransferase involved in cell wall biosynthesis